MNYRSLAHLKKAVFKGIKGWIPKIRRESRIRGERLSPIIGESFRGELFKMKELLHIFTYVRNSPLN